MIENIARQYQTLRELVCASVRRAILAGELPPGQVLRERDLATRLGASKTPVREALRQLEREGLARSVPHKGVVVVGLSSREVKEIYEMRAAPESLAARLAAERMTQVEETCLRELLDQMAAAAAAKDQNALHLLNVRFHSILYDLCGNARLRRTLLDVQEYVHITRTVEWSVPSGFESNHEQHDAIGRAVLQRRPAHAEAHMREHIWRGVELLSTGDGR